MSASTFRCQTPSNLGRLNYKDLCSAAWCTRGCVNNWLQVDMGNIHFVVAVATQGSNDGQKRYITSYSLSYSGDSSTWSDYKENGLSKVCPT